MHQVHNSMARMETGRMRKRWVYLSSITTLHCYSTGDMIHAAMLQKGRGFSSYTWLKVDAQSVELEWLVPLLF